MVSVCLCVSVFGWCARDGYWTLQAVWGSQRLVSQTEREAKKVAPFQFSPSSKIVILYQIDLIIWIYYLLLRTVSYEECSAKIQFFQKVVILLMMIYLLSWVEISAAHCS